MKIVPAADSHVPEIVEIWKEFMDYHGDIDPFFKRRKDGHKNFEKFVRELIKSEESLILAALDVDKLLGYSISIISKYPPVFHYDKYGLIQDMAVRAEHRGSGVGEAMLKETFNWFKSKGIERIELRVISGNRMGYNFWKKHGFRDYIHILTRPLADLE
jgi:ribosomal protein S18 acetylase RimI-like enzyme